MLTTSAGGMFEAPVDKGSWVSRAWRGLAAAELLGVNALMLVVMAIMPLMALAITYEVVARYVFDAPTIWVSDVSAFGLLWIAFLAAPWLVRHGAHIRGDFATERLGPRARAALGTLTSLACAALMAVVLWQTTTETLQDYVKNVHTTGSWEIPRVYVWFVMPIGSLFTVIEFLRAAWLASAPLRGEAVATTDQPPPLARVM